MILFSPPLRGDRASSQMSCHYTVFSLDSISAFSLSCKFYFPIKFTGWASFQCWLLGCFFVVWREMGDLFNSQHKNLQREEFAILSTMWWHFSIPYSVLTFTHISLITPLRRAEHEIQKNIKIHSKCMSIQQWKFPTKSPNVSEFQKRMKLFRFILANFTSDYFLDCSILSSRKPAWFFSEALKNLSKFFVQFNTSSPLPVPALLL